MAVDAPMEPSCGYIQVPATLNLFGGAVKLAVECCTCFLARQMTNEEALAVVHRLVEKERTLAQKEQARAANRAAIDKGLADAGLPLLQALSPEWRKSHVRLDPEDENAVITQRLVSGVAVRLDSVP